MFGKRKKRAARLPKGGAESKPERFLHKNRTTTTRPRTRPSHAHAMTPTVAAVRARTPTAFLVPNHGTKLATSRTGEELRRASRFRSRRMPRRLLQFQNVDLRLRPHVVLRLQRDAPTAASHFERDAAAESLVLLATAQCGRRAPGV